MDFENIWIRVFLAIGLKFWKRLGQAMRIQNLSKIKTALSQIMLKRIYALVFGFVLLIGGSWSPTLAEELTEFNLPEKS